jgi:hypothetical protein
MSYKLKTLIIELLQCAIVAVLFTAPLFAYMLDK